MGQKKAEMCRSVVEKVWRRINDWKFKLLSAAGREVLIKSVIQALPLYMMSVYKIPESCIKQITKLILRFWWDKKEGLRGISWINKGILQKRKLEGGLGFRDLKLFNEALLTKICWRIAKFPNLLMSRVLLAKYCPDGTLGSARLGSSPSHVWRGVMKALKLFELGSWWDAERETLRWKFTSNGMFSVRSAYELIQRVQREQEDDVGEQSDNSGVIRFWKRIWSCKVPNKIKMLCWRLFHNSLPDARNLKRRGVELESDCKMCGCELESALHVMKDCWWAKEIQARLGLCLPVFESLDVDPADWIWSCSSALTKDDLGSFLVALWLCWKNRNKIWHGQEGWRIDQAVIVGKSILKLMNDHSWPSPRESGDLVCGDRSLGMDMMRIQVDGSWELDSRSAGVGIVARDGGGLVLWASASRSSVCSCASEAEGMALLNALKLAAHMNVNKACFEMDSLEVFKVVSTGLGVVDWCGSWMEEAVDLLRSHPAWRIKLVPRELNVLPDLLASKARREGWSWGNFSAIPSCLSAGVFV